MQMTVVASAITRLFDENFQIERVRQEEQIVLGGEPKRDVEFSDHEHADDRHDQHREDEEEEIDQRDREKGQRRAETPLSPPACRRLHSHDR